MTQNIDVVQLQKEVDALTAELNAIKPVLEAFKAANKTVNEYLAKAETQPQTKPEAQTATAAPQPKKLPRTIDLLAQEFPADLRKFMSFEKDGDKAIIRLSKRLEPPDFRRIADTANLLGGQWTSDGAKSRFEVELAKT
jgi:hypothetical protein